MTFNSIEFLIFYPSVLFLYYLMPRRAAWPVLLISSYFFYMCYNPSLVFLIFGTTLVSWVSSILTEGTEKLWLRRLYLGITLISSLGVLFFYKYFNFISLSISSLFGGEGVTLDLLLPVGISFYTFQTLS